MNKEESLNEEGGDIIRPKVIQNCRGSFCGFVHDSDCSKNTNGSVYQCREYIGVAQISDIVLFVYVAVNHLSHGVVDEEGETKLTCWPTKVPWKELDWSNFEVTVADGLNEDVDNEKGIGDESDNPELGNPDDPFDFFEEEEAWKRYEQNHGQVLDGESTLIWWMYSVNDGPSFWRAYCVKSNFWKK